MTEESKRIYESELRRNAVAKTWEDADKFGDVFAMIHIAAGKAADGSEKREIGR